ncbi:MAG: peptide deformylase [Micrococcaceae bacterium]
MSILPIRTVPDPVLRTVSAPVPAERLGTEKLHTLINDMVETMHAVKGVGLAAPQIGINQRIFVFDLEGHSGQVINPILTVSEDLTEEPGEGCLSVPELHYQPPRAVTATVTGVDADGAEVSYSGAGLLARCFQHEVDHLDGKLFVDRLVGEQRKEARRHMSAPGYGAATAQTQAGREPGLTSSFGIRGQGNR